MYFKIYFQTQNRQQRASNCFSGGVPEGSQARYNYLNNGRKIRCNQLYLLDNHGPNERGSYYLGPNRDFCIKRAVKAFIEALCTKYEIRYEDIICCGTSKGGFSALYFAFKYGYGAAVAGAPQVLLGNYLNTERHRYGLKYLAGDTDAESVSFLNGLLINVVRSAQHTPRVYLHCSRNEHHYAEHVLPFLDVATELGIDVTLDLGSYERHEDVGLHFPGFLNDSLINLTK